MMRDSVNQDTGRRARRTMFAAGAGLIGAAIAGVALYYGESEFLRSDRQTLTPATVGENTDSSSSDAFKFSFYDQPHALPEVHFVDGDDRSLSLQDFRGRLVLLNLWATWCVPCRKEMPALDRLEAKLGSPDFEVVALSIDRQGLGAVRPFFKELELKALRIYLDQSGKAAFALNAPGFPTTLLIDREGREAARKIGPAEWDSPEIESTIHGYITRKAATLGASRSRPNSILNINADEVPK